MTGLVTGFATDEAVDELAVEPGMVVCGLCEWQVVCDGGESDCAQSRLLFKRIRDKRGRTKRRKVRWVLSRVELGMGLGKCDPREAQT